MRQLTFRFSLLILLGVFEGCGNGNAQGGSTAAGSGAAGASTAGRGGASSSGGTAQGGSSSGASASGGANSNGGTALGGANSSGANSSGANSSGGAVLLGGASSSGGGAPQAGSARGGEATSGGASALGGAAAGGKVGGFGASAGTMSAGAGGSGGAVTYHPCPTDGSVCKIMPFGDSITDGYNPDTPGGYRVELFRLAHSAGKNITFVGSGYNGPDTVDGVAFPHQHEGHSGWTIAPEGSRSGISTLVTTVMPQFTPHIVLLMIGTNDAIDNYDMTNAPNRLGALIDSVYAKLPSVLIIVAQPIPSRGDASKGDDTALSDRLKTYGDAIPAIAKSRSDAGKHILVVDMYTPFNPNKATLIEDQWHPNLAGYVVLADQWYATLQSLL